jgi:hypothetical protein
MKHLIAGLTLVALAAPVLAAAPFDSDSWAPIFVGSSMPALVDAGSFSEEARPHDAWLSPAESFHEGDGGDHRHAPYEYEHRFQHDIDGWLDLHHGWDDDGRASVVPEPASWVLVLAAAAAIGFTRVRRERLHG